MEVMQQATPLRANAPAAATEIEDLMEINAQLSGENSALKVSLNEMQHRVASVQAENQQLQAQMESLSMKATRKKNYYTKKCVELAKIEHLSWMVLKIHELDERNNCTRQALTCAASHGYRFFQRMGMLAERMFDRELRAIGSDFERGFRYEAVFTDTVVCGRINLDRMGDGLRKVILRLEASASIARAPTMSPLPPPPEHENLNKLLALAAASDGEYGADARAFYRRHRRHCCGQRPQTVEEENDAWLQQHQQQQRAERRRLQ